MAQTSAEINTKVAKPLLSTRISPIALGITNAKLYGMKPSSQAVSLRQAGRALLAIADELDGGVR